MVKQMLQVEVAYAKPECQELIILKVDAGTTVEQVINQTNLLSQFPEIDLALNKVGIFGKVVSLNAKLEAGDRVEIYRPLLIDPRLARREKIRKSTK